MTYKVLGEKLLLPTGRCVEFPHRIAEVSAVGDVLVVLLDVPMEVSFPNNVFGVSMEGFVLWQIEEGLFDPNEPFDYFSNILGSDGTSVRLYNYNGNVVRVHAKTGKVLEIYFVK